MQRTEIISFSILFNSYIVFYSKKWDLCYFENYVKQYHPQGARPIYTEYK